MKQPKLGEGWKFRDKEPESKDEVIHLFKREVKEFKNWINTVSKKRKESLFWECDYNEQLYLDTALELVFITFEVLRNLSLEILDEIIFVIARNHEQGNILAWKNSDTEISYLKMNKTQFRFLAEEIQNRGEKFAKIQVAIVFRKLKNPQREDVELLRKLAIDQDEYVIRQSLITLDKWGDT